MSDNVKSVLHDVTLTVEGSGMYKPHAIPITLKIVVKELNYGPVLDITITSDVKYTNFMDWDDHPLMRVDAKHLVGDGKVVEEIIDDTPAIRAVIAELVSPVQQKLYTTTDCTHRAQLIAFLTTVWS